MVVQSLVIFVVAVVALMQSARVSAQGERKSDEPSGPELGRYLMSGWLKEREKLQWGEVVIEGTYYDRDSDRPLNTFSVESAYSPTVARHHSKWSATERGIWLQYPDRVTEWCYGKSKGVLISTVSPENKNSQYCKGIEPRLISIGGKGMVPFRMPSFSVGAISLTEGVEYVNAKKLEDGAYEMTLRTLIPEILRGKINRSQWVMRMREDQGFSIVSCDGYGAPPGSSEPRFKLTMKTASTWQEFNGVWLPKMVDSSQLSGVPDHNRVKVTFDWKNIGKPIPDEVFDVNKLGAAVGTLIQDKRTPDGEGIIVAKVGIEDPKPPIPTVTTEVKNGVGPKGIAILAANMGVAVLIVFALRRRKHARPTSETDRAAKPCIPARRTLAFR